MPKLDDSNCEGHEACESHAFRVLPVRAIAENSGRSLGKHSSASGGNRANADVVREAWARCYILLSLVVTAAAAYVVVDFVVVVVVVVGGCCCVVVVVVAGVVVVDRCCGCCNGCCGTS